MNVTGQVNDAQELTMDLTTWRSLVSLTRAVSIEWWDNNWVKIVQEGFFFNGNFFLMGTIVMLGMSQ